MARTSLLRRLTMADAFWPGCPMPFWQLWKPTLITSYWFWRVMQWNLQRILAVFFSVPQGQELNNICCNILGDCSIFGLAMQPTAGLLKEFHGQVHDFDGGQRQVLDAWPLFICFWGCCTMYIINTLGFQKPFNQYHIYHITFSNNYYPRPRVPYDLYNFVMWSIPKTEQ